MSCAARERRNMYDILNYRWNKLRNASRAITYVAHAAVPTGDRRPSRCVLISQYCTVVSLQMTVSCDFN